MLGNSDSSGFPVLCETVACADSGTVVRGDPAPLLPDFAAAALMQVPAVRRPLLERKTADRGPPFQSCLGKRPRRFSPGAP